MYFMHYEVLYGDGPNRVMIECDTFLLRVRMFKSGDSTKTRFYNFAPGEVKISETFKTEEAMFTFFYSLTNQADSNYVKLWSDERKIECCPTSN